MTDAPTRGTGGYPEIESAAWAVFGAGLRGEPSALDPSVRTWEPGVAAEILRRVQDNPDVIDNTFLTKLTRQLDGAPRAVIVLTAELLYLQCAPLWNMKAETKRRLVNTVLACANPPITMPKALDDALDHGAVFNGSQGFTSGRRHQLNWLCRCVETWTALPTETRFSALRDPWEFGRTLRQVPKDSTGIRYSLQYIAWPGYYESIVSKRHKIAIRGAFAYVINGESGSSEEAMEKDLHEIRTSLEAATDEHVEWYDSPYIEQWQPGADDVVRAWLIRPGTEGGAALVDRWAHEGFVSLAATYLGHIGAGSTHAQISAAVDAGYQNSDYQRKVELSADYHAFLSRIKPGDIVATRINDQLHVGTVVDEPSYVNDPGARLRRAAQWNATAIAASDLLAPLPVLLEQQGSVVELTDAIDTLQTYVAVDADLDELETEPEIEPVHPIAVNFPLVDDALVRRTHMDRKSLQEFSDLLHARRQIVFYGPPGTGKTYLAQELAHHIAGSDDPSRVRLVQFHPSYAYEDFFEGFRPTESGGFTLTAGPLRSIASAAKASRGTPFVLIIDEMNRANLAKVFGELYFLLEYREKSVQPQYSPDKPFFLPENLYIIGTMNTADRSIAMVDAAIRRRFAFAELHPDETPVRDVLENFLAANGKPTDLHHLLHSLNKLIDRDLRIGPSYLMKPEAESEAGLNRIWKYDLLPLLEEHYFGRLDRNQVHAQFGLDSVRPAPDIELAE
ncbi:McrB family protein [Rhodococcus globerulus]|uniref:McrB family protein n=1 Tax=Rhodococcus globerulus TaxID=33008 RepID=UPI0030195FE1